MAKRTKPKRFLGILVNYEQPDWSHILALVGTELTGDFMWMHEVELTDGTRVHAYKHRQTRRYVHASADGRCFYFDWDSKSPGNSDEIDYVEMPRTAAIDAVFRGWGQMLRPEEAGELLDLVEDAWDMANDDRMFVVDPKELELQRAFEAKQRERERLEEQRLDAEEADAERRAA